MNSGSCKSTSLTITYKHNHNSLSAQYKFHSTIKKSIWIDVNLLNDRVQSHPLILIYHMRLTIFIVWWTIKIKMMENMRESQRRDETPIYLLCKCKSIKKKSGDWENINEWIGKKPPEIVNFVKKPPDF